MRAVVCAAALTISALAPVEAAPKRASMAIDVNTGVVLHNQSGDAPRYPASLTKMMTLYMTFDLIERGQLNYATKIRMTKEGAAVSPSKLGLKPGQEITVLHAIKALVTKSANDVAVALAQHIGGSEPKFARLMTAKARQLGMMSTVFKNASGLPNEQQTTTARDMLTLAIRLQDEFPEHYKLFKTRSFTFRGKSYRNHNALLGRYRGADGIKTGYTRASGFNLVSSVRRDGKHVVAAVFGGKTGKKRNATMRYVLNEALAKASTKKTRKPALVARLKTPPKPVQARRAISQPPQPQTVNSVPRPSPPQGDLNTAGPKVTIANVRKTSIEAHLAPPPTPSAGQQGPATVYAPPASRSDASKFAPPPGTLTTGNTSPSVPSRGTPPSSLQAQAAALSYGSPRGSPHTGDRRLAVHGSPQATQPQRGPYEIQVGAYAAPDDAQRQMNFARQRAGGLLDGYRAIALPVQSGPKQFYRARFQGFNSAAAMSACENLRRQKIDCFVTKAQ